MCKENTTTNFSRQSRIHQLAIQQSVALLEDLRSKVRQLSARSILGVQWSDWMTWFAFKLAIRLHRTKSVEAPGNWRLSRHLQKW